MAKKQASYAAWEIVVDDNGKIIVKESDVVAPNSMSALRTIADAVGFTIEPKWNTQQTGSKLVDFLNNSSTITCCTSKQTIDKVHNKSDGEKLTAVEMKQIEELLKRIEILEVRLERIEKEMHSTAQQQSPQGAAVGKVDEFIWRMQGLMKFKEDMTPYFWDYLLGPNERNNTRGLIANGNYDRIQDISFYEHFWLLTDGRILQRKNCLGDTLREVKAFATLVGYPIPDKAKKEQLAAAIVNEKGGGGICVKGDQLLTSDGYVYKVTPYDFEESVVNLKKNPSIIIPEIPSIDGKLDSASFKLIKKFYNDIKGRPVPSNEAMLAFFDKAVENYKLEYGK